MTPCLQWNGVSGNPGAIQGDSRSPKSDYVVQIGVELLTDTFFDLEPVTPYLSVTVTLSVNADPEF